jgi:hypothetical protein
MEQQLLQEQKKPNALSFQVAIIFATYILILTVLMRIMKMDPQGIDVPTYQVVISSVLTWGAFIFAIFYAQNKHKKELEGFITYGRAFSTGFKVAAYSGLFIMILLVVYYQFIDQAAITQMMDTAIAKANGNEQQIKGIEMMAKYMAYVVPFSSAIVFSLAGLVISLISAAIVKKDRPVHFDSAQ